LRRSAAAPAHARLGAASFLQRFGSALNEHWHHNNCVSDGVFAAAAGQNLAFVSATVSAPIGWPRCRRGCDGGCWRRNVGMACWTRKPPRTWPTGSVGEDSRSTPASPSRADDRPALERLLSYRARPCWASEPLTKADNGERLIYTFDKPNPDGRQATHPDCAGVA